MSVLECLWLPDDHVVLEKWKASFNLDKFKLRSSASAVSGNSWSKAGKKLVAGADFAPYIAKKSLFHCFRILIFAIQICTYGKIVDYSEANYLWKEIMSNPSENWEDFKKLYHPTFLELKSRLRKCAPTPVKK
eukprot:TRINITY_DN4263_c0_g1_i1.p1 TRINITY_DN4263_c0_g1~~TRINITY_DN4263_c0_g1_i1.p1  ORF type:complete len:133 (-),score=7.93 TRINITY_DN4263_c0_g1_i1:98-496(-)